MDIHFFSKAEKISLKDIPVNMKIQKKKKKRCPKRKIIITNTMLVPKVVYVSTTK